MNITANDVQNTELGLYFDTVDNASIFVLDETTASKTWDELIHEGSKSYFHLPDDCWVIAANRTQIGQWQAAYNLGANEDVQQILKASVSWPDDGSIYFFANPKTVLCTKWSVFAANWDSFIALEDDCPIVVPTKYGSKNALLFTALGDIFELRLT